MPVYNQAGMTVAMVSLIALFSKGVDEPGKEASTKRRLPENRRFREVHHNIPEYVDSAISWYGEVEEVIETANGVRLRLEQVPAKYVHQPVATRYSQGRFIAEALFEPDSAVTEIDAIVAVHGSITGSETRPLGDNEYVYPVVRAVKIEAIPRSERIRGIQQEEEVETY